MKRATHATLEDTSIIEPCPTAVGRSTLPVPRALAGWPPGLAYVPREPVLDLGADLHREVRDLLALADGRRGPRRAVRREHGS